MDRYKLGDICEIVSGSTPKTGIAEYWDGDLKWITPAELDDDSYIITDTVRKITDLAVKKTGLSSFPEGTVILSSRAPIGKVAIAGCEMYCNQGFKNLICSDKINNKYLYWFLKGNTEFLNSLGRGATFKEISKQIVANIDINIPDYDRQKEIVEQLEKSNKIINLRKRELVELDNLIKARFVELFGTPLLNEKGWEVKSTGDVCSVTDGSHFSPVGKEDGYPMLSVRNMRNDGFHYDDCKLVSQEDYDILVKQGCKPLKNDVLIAKDGSYFYYGFVVKEEIEQAVLSSIAILRPNLEEINPEYLCRYMLSSEIVDLVGKNYVTGAAIKRVILKGIKQIPVMLPPMELQNQFATFVEQTDKSKFAVQKALDEAQLLFDSLMQKYFG